MVADGVVPGSGLTSGRTLVVAFEGWNDAGEAASQAVKTVRELLSLTSLMEVESEDYFDYQFNRPVVTSDDDGNRLLVWPSVTIYGPDDGSAVYLLLGTEPSRGWKSFTEQILVAVRDAGVTGIVMLGAMLADVPHTRPISVFVTSENPAVREEFSIEKSSYEGPVGILSVLGEMAEKAGIPTLSIWASVPHYVHNAPSPKATLAIIDKLEEIIGIVIPRGDLPDEAATWESGIDALASEDDDMSSYIEQLEQARDTVDSPEASGEAIAEEFEKYLRGSGDEKPEGGSAGDQPWRPQG
ncbi:MAG: hypothetical protein RI885_1826 [Actinomycetota bacterium]